MLKRLFFIFIFAAVLGAFYCQKPNRDTEAVKIAAEYKAVQRSFLDQMKNATSESQQESILANKKKSLETLLQKYEGKTSSDAAELLKSQLLIEISAFTAANQKIEELIKKKSALLVDAKMAKVESLVGMGDIDKALELFKEIEPQLEKEKKSSRFTGWLYISLYSKNLDEMETYSQKLIAEPGLPEYLSLYQADIYWNLAAIAKTAKDYVKAERMLTKALTMAWEPKKKVALKGELAQMEFLGKPAFPILADAWLNSPPLSMEELKGKVLVVEFWAPWSPDCRTLLTLLDEEYNKYKNRGLVVVGYTKLYGNYQDNLKKAENIDRKEEVGFIQEFVNRSEWMIPIAISYEGYNFEDYKITAVPAAVFVDRQGNISDIITGAGKPQLIRYKIKKLLEDTNGKN